MNNYNWNDAFPDAPKSFKNKVSATLNNLPDQKENSEMEKRKTYKKGSIKKRIMIALVATMVIGTSVFAAGKIVAISGSTSNIPTYTSVPTVEQVKNDFGFNAKLVKNFDNGYNFTNGHTDNKEGLDEQGGSVEKIKSLDFSYKKGNDEISLSMANKRLGERSEKEVVVNTYKGIDLYYLSYANKCVPEDYKMTEQDKKDEASGKYVFSYGSEKEEISQVQHLSWEQDGINYSFLAMDSDISQDGLVKMAQQVIDTK